MRLSALISVSALFLTFCIFESTASGPVIAPTSGLFATSTVKTEKSASLLQLQRAWMTDAWPQIKGENISTLWIPGTHDTFTYDLDRDYISAATSIPNSTCGPPVLSWAASVAPSLVMQWATTQTQDIVTQLDMGFRYFDLRPNFNGTDIHFQHECVRTKNPISIYFNEIASWLSSLGSDAKEIIILHFKDYSGSWNERAYTLLADIINKSLGSFLYGSNQANADNLTLDNIISYATASPPSVQKGPKVLCVMEAPDGGTTSLTVPGSDRLINYQSFMSRSWPNVNTVEALLAASDKYVAQRPVDKVLVLEGMITPRVRDAVQQTLRPGSGHLPSILLSWEQGYLDTTNLFLRHVASHYWAAHHAAPTMRQEGVVVGDHPHQLHQLHQQTASAFTGMVLMLDNPHEVDAAFIANLNMGAPESGRSVLVPFSYGSCAVKYDVWKFKCEVQMPDSCLESYNGTALFVASSLSCHGMCCRGHDCGCGKAQMELCSLSEPMQE
ncbi:hypothetical protein CEUSTIGMA_g2741.t1 [Chlamydomonas eustigma]|uniref:Phosphatidylinositol-specific phospholipase C X domain-containing protein n=1 Tax=Chlamydomonas eustigma TaxID=1157962 RepID=A0A250WWY8_9CHLO|nr:hypothetical protein CEUSTIGMA_g2741.t1 [Chlamydomonas eustigma]|eukprot:GAX75296.1 hypothetical protein CEUSTIGMA_g2741.t1 [Chlamydomonas eustigma]